MREQEQFGWLGILRLGLVQAAIGAIVVLTTSTMNRVMVVELALPAMLPGILVALHYFVQVFRPRLGYGSDLGGRRGPWIVGGMAALALGAIGASLAIALMGRSLWLGVALAVASFVVIGLGVGSAGTTMLVLMSKRVAPQRLAAAATVTWVMMIVGFILTTVIVGQLIDPFTPARLVQVTTGVAGGAFLLSCFAVYGIEQLPRGRVAAGSPATDAAPVVSFREALSQVWHEPHSRRLASFIFVSMLAYSAQDLILEPFAGAVFGMSPGQSTKLSGVQNSGVLLGMLMVAVIGTVFSHTRFGSMRRWTVLGCVASAAMLLVLSVASFIGPAWPLRPSVFCLGLANGVFAVAAIGSMMGLVGAGQKSREGVRMGLWGAAQAVAFALGGLAGTGVVDAVRYLFGSPLLAYAVVFAGEAVLFVVATTLAVRTTRGEPEINGFPSAADPEGYAPQARG